MVEDLPGMYQILKIVVGINKNWSFPRRFMNGVVRFSR